MSYTGGSNFDSKAVIRELVNTAVNRGATLSNIQEAYANLEGSNYDFRAIIGLLKIISTLPSGGTGEVGVPKQYVDDQDSLILESANKYSDSKLVTIDIESRSDGTFWTIPIHPTDPPEKRPTSTDIINLVNSNKDVRLHFFDTVTNTGDQLYSYETTDSGVPYFRRNVVSAFRVERINIGVYYNGEVKFEKIPLSSTFVIAFRGIRDSLSFSEAVDHSHIKGQKWTSGDIVNIDNLIIGCSVYIPVKIKDQGNRYAYIIGQVTDIKDDFVTIDGKGMLDDSEYVKQKLDSIFLDLENKADRSIYLLGNSVVTQEDARDVLTYADQYTGLIEFISTSESKVAAVGYILSNLDGTCLVTVTSDGTTTQWGRDSFAKYNIEAHNLINEGMVDIDNLTVDVVGNPPVLYLLRNAINKPEKSGQDGAMFVIPHAINKQLFLYTDMDTGNMWIKTVTGTADQHSFGQWVEHNVTPRSEVILTSPDGSQFRVKVDNSGVLSAEKVV